MLEDGCWTSIKGASQHCPFRILAHQPFNTPNLLQSTSQSSNQSAFNRYRLKHKMIKLFILLAVSYLAIAVAASSETTELSSAETIRVSRGSSFDACKSRCEKWYAWCMFHNGFHHYGDCIRCVVACNRTAFNAGDHSTLFNTQQQNCRNQYSLTQTWDALAKTSRGSYDTCA